VECQGIILLSSSTEFDVLRVFLINGVKCFVDRGVFSFGYEWRWLEQCGAVF